jgi:uncharacterized damage-inducible protein DinB
MATSDPLEILLVHNEWATRQLLDACQALSAEQFQQKFEIGPGSLHMAITHIIQAMRAWTDMLAGRERRPPLEVMARTPEQLLAFFDEAAAELGAVAPRHPVTEMVSGTRQGKTYTFTRGGVLTHVLTHGMHHRAQCLNMLRQLGAKQPSSSVLEWMLMVDHPQ